MEKTVTRKTFNYSRLLSLFILITLIILHFTLFKTNSNTNIWDSYNNINLLPRSQLIHSTTTTTTTITTKTTIITEPERLNAAFVILLRNGELKGILESMESLEQRFNSKFNYPYIFLNEQNFTQEFKLSVANATKSEVKFGTIPLHQWKIPNWIDQPKMRAGWENLEYPNFNSIPYRHMCRFYSGFFYQHPLVRDLDYYWRVEPEVDFHCDINYDPFKFMRDNNKLYSFTIPIWECMPTVASLMSTVDSFISENNLQSYFPKDSAHQVVRNVDGTGYNGCQFWNNFEIASLSIWKTPLYNQFFNYLDKSGGFYYERWGDAPIHTIYVSLFLKLSEIHFFEDISYRHGVITHCPQGEELYKKGNCSCDRDWSHDWTELSCMSKWLNAKKGQDHKFILNPIK
ncbi:glycosyltransferase family 15 protein [Conidiobolus coronatus NRRL 28638]|uniref:Glycosyltransferase family 15 protein n=1 Tax=Conidiobolus coronatus (strain ATCC 28846 / CBS 209.66 / NRRL 28638) TaxID=796925 RepID=A0A137NS05_CONC2|nr:glycosyltransferase family 15 protein [Conidiobolus coronatus NRRL 28638]|eukprot:KXN65528.1 glycosyltransferase family 15 protein [Conidiobolus coronatus NRRL 28638]